LIGILKNLWQEKSPSVKIEFSIWVILLLSVTTATLTWFMLSLEREALTREVTRRGVALTQYVATHSIDPFLTNDKLSLATLVADAMKNEDMVYALITDRDGRIVASDRSEQIGKAYLRPLGLYPLDRPVPCIYAWKDGKAGWVLDIGIPLILEQKTKIGEVHVGVSQSTINKVVTLARNKAAGLAGLFLLAGLMGSILLVTLMLQPVSELTKGVQAISAGDWDYRIPIKRRNELGQLAATFNRMTGELKVATEQALEQERIKKELQVAQQIQHMLLPKQTPEVKGFSFASLYRAAKEVGGDYYDFIQVGEDNLGIAVADVCGKGVPAALLMSVARSILKSVAPNKLSPAEVVCDLNHLLLSDLSHGLFITLFYAVVDIKKKTLTYTSAGHNPVLIWHSRSREFTTLTLEPPCLPLGLDNSSLFRSLAKERKVLLKPGDLVILYTDGVTEAMNTRGEPFRLEGLMDAIRSQQADLAADDILQGLDAELSRFCGEQSQSDDIAVVAMKVE
jgi:serine phosphatase RsbU (regulator of sigma subunit)